MPIVQPLHANLAGVPPVWVERLPPTVDDLVNAQDHRRHVYADFIGDIEGVTRGDVEMAEVYATAVPMAYANSHHRASLGSVDSQARDDIAVLREDKISVGDLGNALGVAFHNPAIAEQLQGAWNEGIDAAIARQIMPLVQQAVENALAPVKLVLNNLYWEVQDFSGQVNARLDRLDQRVDELGRRVDCLSLQAAQDSIILAKMFNRKMRHEPRFMLVRTAFPPYRHLTELEPPLPPVTSIADVRGFDAAILRAIHEAYYPNTPVPRDHLSRRRNILRAVGCHAPLTRP
ncbi:hypothetical protein DACRYDRAFT_119100 [Dacryopinax primogenitus]|uniref:Mug135-like C-terminal domain-containing protein n=1 Tax=Dacryopinax primogenitus (strain DJM 731) TaxID=1858805 RepID=M5FWS9_DACPD|nr:uncharacterized protein DACRYDRAFT_119100 [Dacryopinax primogenitus]EJT97901.1 hypothetical protein DACRYDRAFT_119100 [Dacryopinax primogenitus]